MSFHSKTLAQRVKFLNPQDTVVQDTFRIVGLREPVVENPDILSNHLSQPDFYRGTPKRLPSVVKTHTRSGHDCRSCIGISPAKRESPLFGGGVHIQ